MKQRKSFLLASLAMLVVTTGTGQPATTGYMLSIKGHSLNSGLTKKSYQLYVSLPKSYSDVDTVRYPVLYVLDGKYAFPSFSAIREVMDLGKELEEVIIVAIADSNLSDSVWLASRYSDFTPSAVPQADSDWTKMMRLPAGTLKSGGAQQFLEVIKKELLPFIDQQYKTTTDRGISGHSLGGLFVSYCLVTAPELFKRYGINSPAFWWNNNELLTAAKTFIQRQETLDATIFMSVGSLEGGMMVTPMNTFATTVKSRSYKDLTLTTQVFDNESHLSVNAASNSRTLRVLYGARKK